MYIGFKEMYFKIHFKEMYIMPYIYASKRYFFLHFYLLGIFFLAYLDYTFLMATYYFYYLILNNP